VVNDYDNNGERAEQIQGRLTRAMSKAGIDRAFRRSIVHGRKNIRSGVAMEWRGRMRA